MKLTLLILILSISGIAIVSIASFMTINNLVEYEKQSTVNSLKKTSVGFSGLISRDLNERISDVKLLADVHSPLFSEVLTLSEKENYVSLFLTAYSDYDSISVYDVDGIKILDSDNFGIGNSIVDSEMFKQTIQNSSYYDLVPIFKNKSNVNDSLSHSYDDHTVTDIIPIIRFASLIVSDDGVVRGVVVANYSISSLFDNLQMLSDHSIQFEILTSDRHSIVNSINHVTLPPDTHLNLIPNTVFIDDTWIISSSTLPEVGHYTDNSKMLVVAKINQTLAFKEIISQQQSLQIITVSTFIGLILFMLLIIKKLANELFHIQNILMNAAVGKKFIIKNLFFKETQSFQLDIISAEKLLHNSKISNLQKLDMFDNISKIMHLISDGNLSHTLELSDSDSTDISELKLNINRAIEQLSKVELDRSSFSAMITHELKTPLVPIKGYAEMLKKEKLGPLTIDQKDAVHEILLGVESLYVLIKNILTAQKESSDSPIGKLTTMNTRKLIEQVYAKMLPAMESKKINFKKSDSIDSLISIEYEKIIEVFVNLIQNSIDFVPKINGTISIGCTKNDVGVLFFVKDNGIGMTKDQQNKIFKKFYQIDTSATRKHGGTGLGLSICKSIIENHGGTIWATGNSGTTVFFTIPSQGTTGANFN